MDGWKGRRDKGLGERGSLCRHCRKVRAGGGCARSKRWDFYSGRNRDFMRYEEKREEGERESKYYVYRLKAS